MADADEVLLHGTLHATIYEIDRLHTGSGPGFLKKVYHFTLCIGKENDCSDKSSS